MERKVKGLVMTVKIDADDALEMVEKLKAEGKVAAVVHAHWVDITPEGCKYGRRFKCSRCGRGVALVPMQYDQGVSARYPYCHCGAKMDEEVILGG